jgi:hypothetical protein
MGRDQKERKKGLSLEYKWDVSSVSWDVKSFKKRTWPANYCLLASLGN